jgi:hypothetical protein
MHADGQKVGWWAALESNPNADPWVTEKWYNANSRLAGKIKFKCEAIEADPGFQNKTNGICYDVECTCPCHTSVIPEGLI